MGNRLAPAPQPLPDDRIYDILLRLAPDDPAGIIRASAVCKAWRRIISDPSFHGQYRTLHPTAPVLGFLHRPRNNELTPRFVSTTSFRPAAADHRQHPLDCRHGCAVFYDYCSHSTYVVWDPVTGELHKLPKGPGGEGLPHPAVVCAAGGGCDHRGCSRGPFVVAFVSMEEFCNFNAGADADDDDDAEDDDKETTVEDETTDEDDEDKDGPYFDAHACFYASDTGEWAGDIHVQLVRPGNYLLDVSPAALVGDSLYFLCTPQGILRYRFGLLRRLGSLRDMIRAGIREDDVLSMTELPRWKRLGIGKNTNVVVMTAEGSGLGLACQCPKTRMLYLLAREAGDTVVGVDQWVQRRVIDLQTLLPAVRNNPKRQLCLCGIAQEANVIFVTTEDVVFSIDLRSSLQVRKVCETGIVNYWIHPFVSFYTESLLLKLASNKLPERVGNQ